MNEFWLYILVGFFGGMIFCFLLLVGLIKRLISIAIVKGNKDE